MKQLIQERMKNLEQKDGTRKKERKKTTINKIENVKKKETKTPNSEDKKKQYQSQLKKHQMNKKKKQHNTYNPYFPALIKALSDDTSLLDFNRIRRIVCQCLGPYDEPS